MTIKKFQDTILTWHRTNRRDMPWRNTNDPYKILVSEIMLQQTQVARVIPKYEEFLKAFPTLLSLARAKDTKLLKVWQGLGYWRRAKYLKQTAQKILVEAKKTKFQMSPRRPAAGREHRSQNLADFEDRSFENLFSEPKRLEALPGIGHYTARAIACFAFGNTEAFLDTNIRRVYLHFFFPKRQKVADSEILPIAQKAIDSFRLRLSFRRDFGVTREWHYALFDYGAMVLKNKKINKQSKHYHTQAKFKGSFRSFRTKVVQFLLSKPKSKTTKKTIENFLQKELTKEKSKYASHEIIVSLIKDNLIKNTQTHYSL